MRAVLVDVEPISVNRILQMNAEIPNLNIIGDFNSADQALTFIKTNEVDVVFIVIDGSKKTDFFWQWKYKNVPPTYLLYF